MELHHPDAAVEMLAPIAAGEVGIGDGAAGVGGVDELPVPGVDAGVGDAAGVGTGEEHDVPGLQIGLVHHHAGTVLGLGGAAHGNAEGAVDIVHKAGAVKAAGGSAAVDIGGAQIFRGLGENLRPSGRAGVAGIHTLTAGDRLGGAADGQGADGLAAPEILGGVVGCPVFVGNFAQAEIIASYVAG